MNYKPYSGWLSRLTTRVVNLETGPTFVILASGSRDITAEEALRGIVVSNKGAGGAVTFNLPVAAPGMEVTAVVQAAQNLTLDPPATCKIFTSAGVDLTAGVASIGNDLDSFVTLRCFAANEWRAVESRGIFDADGN